MSSLGRVPDWMVGTSPRIRTASKIKPRELDPVWPSVLWAGKPTMSAGDPGLGKSLVTADAAARVTTGAPWPCSDEEREPGNVVMLSAEDDPDDTIVPRLIAAGADLDRITFVEGLTVRDEDGERHQWLSLDRDIHHLESVIEARKPRLVIIDPISAYMGNVDSHRTADVRMVLGQVGDVASRYRTAVLVVSHLNKSNGTKAMYRVTGSLAFTAAARAVYAVTRDPDDEDRRLFLPVKSNLGPDSDGYRYVIKVNDEGIPFVEWAPERETRRIGEVLDDETPRQAAINERDQEVVEWLRTRLADEPRTATSMWSEAASNGFSEREVRRAKKAAGVRAEVLGFQGQWHWRLP